MDTLLLKGAHRIPTHGDPGYMWSFERSQALALPTGQAATSAETPWAPQSGALGLGPTQRWADISSGTPGPCSQRAQDLGQPMGRLAQPEDLDLPMRG